jgi:hypothetical protein
MQRYRGEWVPSKKVFRHPPHFFGNVAKHSGPAIWHNVPDGFVLSGTLSQIGWKRIPHWSRGRSPPRPDTSLAHRFHPALCTGCAVVFANLKLRKVSRRPSGTGGAIGISSQGILVGMTCEKLGFTKSRFLHKSQAKESKSFRPLGFTGGVCSRLRELGLTRCHPPSSET